MLYLSVSPVKARRHSALKKTRCTMAAGRDGAADMAGMGRTFGTEEASSRVT